MKLYHKEKSAVAEYLKTVGIKVRFIQENTRIVLFEKYKQYKNK